MLNEPVLLKPTQYAEKQLISKILDGTYPPGGFLPAERILAVQLKVTRPTLRETIQRLAREGWLTIRHGKPTRVNNYLTEGGLGVLSTMAGYGHHLGPDTVLHMLQVRDALIPSAAKMAAENEPEQLIAHLAKAETLSDDPFEFASFDWELQILMTRLSGNSVFSMIFNDFENVYLLMAHGYFTSEQSRRLSRNYYEKLLDHLTNRKPGLEIVVQETMEIVNSFWRELMHQDRG